jgi:DNA-binding cell septation regulator SpoVG
MCTSVIVRRQLNGDGRHTDSIAIDYDNQSVLYHIINGKDGYVKMPRRLFKAQVGRYLKSAGLGIVIK